MQDRLKRVDRRVLRQPMRDYFTLLAHALDGCESLLDVGCGRRSPLEEVERLPPLRHGVEVHPPAAAEARNRGFYEAVHQVAATDIGDHFDPASYDAVVTLDVIEHLEKDAGDQLIADMGRIASKRVIIFTPNGFVPQEDPDNPWMLHRSGWTVGELESRGFRVAGIHGLRWLCSDGSLPLIKPFALGYRISGLSQHLVRRRPQLGFHLLAVKDVA